MTICIKWVWQSLNKGARHVCGLEMTNKDAFMNTFGGLFEVKVLFQRHTERTEK